MRVATVLFLVAACGDNQQSSPTDTPIDSPRCPSLACDDGDPCTHDVCHERTGCQHVALDRCADPTCALGACAGPDSDGDGLSDAWEQQGYVDIDCDGELDPAIDLELPGADPAVPDVFVEIDFMAKPGSGNACSGPSDCTVPGETCVASACTHSHAPDPAGLQEVVDAFTAHGVRLHIDPVHDAIPEAEVLTFGGSMDPACVGTDAVALSAVKAMYFDPRRRNVYRYAVFAHHHTCTNSGGASCGACPIDPVTGSTPVFGASGIADLPGKDFVVSLGHLYFDLGVSRTPERDGGVFMHELGHTFGLQHGGDQALPALKPNYLSVMGAFIFTGVPFTATPGTTSPIIGHRLDYSGAELPTLDENALDENAGLGGTGADVTAFTDGTFQDVSGATSGPIDWNGSGTIETPTVAVDINSDGVFSRLTGWRDWPDKICASAVDCPLLSPSGTVHVPCVQLRCATFQVAFQCVAAVAPALHSDCRP